MTLNPLLLSRIQFGWHILLPAFTVGAASYIALLEGLHLATGRGVYLQVSNFWIRIFAVAFGMGVVTGIVMPFQFGTNWSGLSDAAGNIIGPSLAYEGLTAFFLEAAFLGVLLFGRALVPPWAHFIAAMMVALGALFSSFWILAANSWMQTPVGYTIVDGRFLPMDWLQIIFSPSFPYRFAHTVVAFYVTTGFAAGIAEDRKSWLFRTARGDKADALSDRPMNQPDAWLMIRRRAVAAGITAPIGCHTFRATGITAYLVNGGALEHAQEMAGHESPRTTKLYDRTKERLTQDEVERIRL